ncbi:regulator of chromosome condensation [Anaeramoeba flamelloides]|uniref:Regulator of chromosome condensation n=1 Tax=Anaeramoeba flamelloides TaxID=1746091 RepID=A0AAV7ZF67_9EUKA|nr:regulator of chromosome condensation [Anaeramoeba flamelloides]
MSLKKRKEKKTKHDNNLPYISPLTKITNIKKIVMNKRKEILILKTNNEIQLKTIVGEKKVKKTYYSKKEEIIDIQAGHKYFLLLSKSGKVFSLAETKYLSKGSYWQRIKRVDKNVPLIHPEQSTWNQLRSVNFFLQNNLIIKSIWLSASTYYFLCNDGKLYVSGKNDKGQFGSGNDYSSNLPIFIRNDIQKIFVNSNADSLFFITKKKKLFGCGDNTHSKLGLYEKKQKEIEIRPKEIFVDGVETNEIKDIEVGSCHSVLITKKGTIYGCGDPKFNGTGHFQNNFTKIPKLQEKKIILISVNYVETLALTQDNELFGWGFINKRYPCKKIKEFENFNSDNMSTLPIKIKMPNLAFSRNIKIFSAHHAIFIYNSFDEKPIKKDFENVLNNNQQFSKKIISQFQKTLIETRTNCKLSKIQEIFQKNFKKKELNIFLKWVYFDQKKWRNEKLMKNIFNCLNLTFIQNENESVNSFENSLLKLYQDDESKDFSILIPKEKKHIDLDLLRENFKLLKFDDKNEKEFNNQNSLKVHKFILIARCGLYRGLFEFVENDNDLNEINDYSGKSKECLKIFFKYLYTDKIDLNINGAKNNQIRLEVMVEDLEDLAEYYQLNSIGYFNDELKRITKTKVNNHSTMFF